MNLAGKKILVAGASGMVGRSVVSYLLQAVPDVKVRASSFSQKVVFPQDDRNEQVVGDLRQLEDCKRIVRGCDAVIMTAATTGGIVQQREEPWRQVNDNLFMNAQILEACHAERVHKVLLVGSATCYQESESRLAESDLDWSQDPYEAYLGIGWVTRYLEKLALFWSKKSDLQITCLRSANIFGPYAKFDPSVSNFIPAIIRKAVGRMNPMEVWGPADVSRDVIYVEDFASACVTLLQHEGNALDVFNVGLSQAVKVGDIVKWAIQYAGYEAAVHYTENGLTSIKSRILDCHKLKQATNWSPRFTIEEGVRLTTEWWKENKEHWKR